MTQTRTHKGVVFTARASTGNSSRIVWEGGVRGGTIFENEYGQFGCATEWFDKFGDAADVTIRRCHAVYLKAKKLVEEYEGKKKRKKT